MALQHTGVDIELAKNEATGKFDIAWSTSGPNKGNPILGNTRAHTVFSLLRSNQGQYYWDTTGKRGSLLYTVGQDNTTTRSKLISYSEQAMQPIIDDNTILSFTADATRTRPGSYALTVNWSTTGSKYSSQVGTF